jgi:DNA-binding transcriptional MerR regulator
MMVSAFQRTQGTRRVLEKGLRQLAVAGHRVVTRVHQYLYADVVGAGFQVGGEAGNNGLRRAVDDEGVDESVAAAVGDVGGAETVAEQVVDVIAQAEVRVGDEVAGDGTSVTGVRTDDDLMLGLEPAVVDPDSGYRYYTSEQIPAAQVIYRLRELDMPLREVREMMEATDPDARASLVAAHLSRLESELDRTRMAVTSLRRLLRPEPGRLDVELRSVPPMTVAAVGETVDQARVLEWYDSVRAELDAALAGRQVTGPPGGRYAGELFTDGRGDVLIYAERPD